MRVMAPGDDITGADGDVARRPTAIVSWAHGNDAWQDTVLEFATKLRVAGGVDVDLDLWHLTDHQDWTTFGPTAIRESDFVIVAINSAYRNAWQGTNAPGMNAGAGIEAAAIKAIHAIDHNLFRKRVVVVVLPGASVDDIPSELRSLVEHFHLNAFDKQSLEGLLRSIYGEPLHLRPPLGPLPLLPRRFVDAVSAVPGGEGITPPSGDGRKGDADTVDVLTKRLTLLMAEIQSSSPTGGGARSRVELERIYSTIEASLTALKRSGGTEPNASPGLARQRMISDYLYAQLYLSAGAHKAAEKCLAAVRARLPDPDRSSDDLKLEPCMRQLAGLATALNNEMRDGRFRAVARPRHPKPPPVDVLERKHRERMRMFYEVARCAMNEPNPSGSLSVIRDAILHGRRPPEAHAERLAARYTERQRIATTPLGLRAPTRDGRELAGADWLEDSGLHRNDGALASVVISALAEAHLLVHLVEHHRSGPVGHILNPGRDLQRDGAYLRRSIMLNTWVLAIGETMPWIFAADEQERTLIQGDAELARKKLDPFAPMWHARQVTLLSLYRRSHGFRLLGDNERAYNDLQILQRIGRQTGSVRQNDHEVTGWLDTLKALAEYRIGELYRADHDYMQALVQLCRSHDSVETLRKGPQPTIAGELGHLEVKLSLGKGKAFFEIGAMKRSLKWYLTAWRSMLDLQEPGADRKSTQETIESMESYLDRVKHDSVLDKHDAQLRLALVVKKVCGCKVEESYEALAADILVRISHLLVILRLPEDDPQFPGGRESSALRCMKRAAELDDRNLLVHTELLRYEIRTRKKIELPEHPALECWPSGASDVDQLIRTGEHLTLKQLRHPDHQTDGEIRVARQLVDHFMTHTDSINLRGAILHRYVTRPRAEDREPWWEPAPPARRRAKPPAPMTLSASAAQASGRSLDHRSKHYLEFVCLRRYGSFTPFMPRPAAVSAVGGGYLVRICTTIAAATEHQTNARDDSRAEERLEVFNIVIDPGEGTVNNLYGAGLSIADIDMVIATHDHPDHLSALDSIISLRKERRKAQPDVATPRGDERLLILGNRSVVNRYSFLNGDSRHLVQHIADAGALGGKVIPENVTIEALTTKHQDLGGHPAAAFVLSLAPPSDGGVPGTAWADPVAGSDPSGSDAARLPLTITFMADTATEGFYLPGKPNGSINEAWLTAMQSDIVVAHVSDIPSHELAEIGKFPGEDARGEIPDFIAKIKQLEAERPEDASQLRHALPLSPIQPGNEPVTSSDSSDDDSEDSEQLYLEGLLEVCRHMQKAHASPSGGARVLIVGELKEQLGSFRRTIAREINERIFKDASAPLRALTADIGLRIRVATPRPQATDRNTVLCSTCSYNNDRLDVERFHPPQDIHEVCVKGDHEAIYWNCELHDPGQPERQLFVEQMGGYNPFAAGGRYHG
jgi:hypothetical protein